MTFDPRDPHIATASGALISLLHPDPALIEIGDIARALSNVCRFGGMTTFHFSIARHSLLVSELVLPDLALTGLLHDAAEAYLGDVSSPLKSLLPEYQAIERIWAKAIGEKFGVDLVDLHPNVKRADARALVIEGRELVPSFDWEGIYPDFADPPALFAPEHAFESAVRFLNRFLELTRGDA